MIYFAACDQCGNVVVRGADYVSGSEECSSARLVDDPEYKTKFGTLLGTVRTVIVCSGKLRDLRDDDSNELMRVYLSGE